MADKDLFAERGRTLEEEYFRKREKELIEKMRQRAQADAERRRLGEEAGIADQEILQDLQALGYTAETVTLLHVVPLVQMAWAEGNVSERERELIIEAARTRGVQQGSPADHQLDSWLTRRPTEQFFEKTLRAIGAILQAQPAEERAASQKDLLSYCTAIASASGGIMGFRRVSDEERQILGRISQEFEKAHGPTQSSRDE